MILSEYHGFKSTYDPPAEIPVSYIVHPRSDTIFTSVEEYLKWYDLPYWTPYNPINNAARINSLMLSDEAYYENRSYLRVQNLSLGYNLSPSLLSKLKINHARIALNIDNAAVFTKWIEGDPESMREMPRTYSLSLDFSF